MYTIANHSEFKSLLKLDIQYFAGEEDAILPDDFVAGEVDNPGEQQIDETLSSETELGTNEPGELDDLLNPEGQEEPPQTQDEGPQMIKVKFNHEDQEIAIDEAVPLIQKGMNYDKLQERLQQFETDPRLSFVEELAQEQGMDVNEFVEAVRSAREQAKLDELVQQNIPEEYAREMLESRKFREQLKAEQQAKEEESKRTQEFNEFFEYFQKANERAYDPTKDQVPQEVWDMHEQQGVPLKFAYMEHHNNELKAQLATLKQNQKNTNRAPINGVTQFGGDDPSNEDLFMKGFDSI